jgi:inner membrane protein
MLSDRAIKYGLLFVALTFASVALAELLARSRVRRVHPVQYAMVGLTLCLFFLLLLSLSEHLAFATAYAVAASACVLLLGIYARHMLGSARDGWLFGAGMALLYGMLYLLLLREQTALVLGSVGLFAALAVVMLLTRRVDWYRLTATSQSESIKAS